MIFKTYNLVNELKVRNFIQDEKNLSRFLKEITPMLMEYFPDGEYYLRYDQDPEINNLEYLLLTIRLKNFKEKVYSYTDILYDLDSNVRSLKKDYGLIGKVILDIGPI